MTLQTIKGLIYLPVLVPDTSTPSVPAFVLDASGEKLASIIQAPKTGNISKVVWRTANVVTGDTLDIRLETVSTSTGDPTGTLLDTNTNASQAVANGDDSVQFTTTLTSDAAVTKGDIFAVVIVNGAGGGDLTVTSAAYCGNTGFPYVSHFTTSWTKDDRTPMIALEYDDGNYYPMPNVASWKTISSATFNNTDTPDEYGSIFNFPYPVSVVGFWGLIDWNSGVTADITLYDSDGTTELLSHSHDADIARTTTSETSHMLFSSSVELKANTNYRIAVEATSASDMSLRRLLFETSSHRDAWAGEWQQTTRKDAGAWTEDDTFFPMIGLIVNGFGPTANLLHGKLG